MTELLRELKNSFFNIKQLFLIISFQELDNVSAQKKEN